MRDRGLVQPVRGCPRPAVPTLHIWKRDSLREPECSILTDRKLSFFLGEGGNVTRNFTPD